MREVLTNPIHGFYLDNETVIGSKGHFVTSPEISQMFGESIAVWLLNEWMKMGEPKEIQLVELGPGTGTLMADILRTFAKIRPELVKRSSVHLVEVSPRMRRLQSDALGCSGPMNEVESNYGSKVFWHDHVWDVPEQFSFYVAHEFFDALAVNKFQRVERDWREVLVDVEDSGDSGDKLRYVIARNATPACVLLEQDGVREALEVRSSVEISASAWTMVRMLSQRIVEQGGAALVADYGHLGTDGDTLRAFHRHAQVDPLGLPGSADITADVDFSLLRTQVCADCSWHGPVSQAQFLHSCGIETRCQQLLSSCAPEQQQTILDSFVTLTSPERMGERFKFVSLFPGTMRDIHEKYPPVGFEESS